MPIQFDNTNTGLVTLKGPASSSSNLSFPSSLGTSNQALITNGSGTLSWVSLSSPTIAGFTFTSASNLIAASGGTTNQGAAVVAKGAGGFLVNIPDATATGGNARGSYSVDLQAARASSSSVASGSRSIILGGYASTASGSSSIVAGNLVTATTDAIVLGGIKNQASSGADGSIMIGAGGTSTYSVSTTAASEVVFGGYVPTTANLTLSAKNSFILPTKSFSGPIGSFSYASIYASSSGDVQLGGVTTSGSTTAQLTSDAGAAGSSNRINASIISYIFGSVIARSSTGLSKIWSINAAGSNLAGVNPNYVSVSVLYSDTGTSSWNLTITNSSGYWELNAQGDSSLTVRWFAAVSFVY